MHKVIHPNWGNMWVFVFLFGGLSLALAGICIYRQEIDYDAIAISLLLWVPVVWGYYFLKFQSVIVDEKSITHTKLGLFKKETKSFYFEDIKYYKFVQLTLMVVKEGGKVPELPHGIYADLSGVLLIPASTYMPNTKDITDLLDKKGVRKR